MKKKLLSILVSTIVLYVCIFALAACDKNEPTHTHNYSTLKFDNETHWFECVCGDTTSIESHKGGTASCEDKPLCSICNSKYGSANGHTTITDKAVPPTCTTPGKTEGSHCEKCSEILTAQKEVPAEGHSWQDVDCESPTICTICSAIAETETGYEAGHDWFVATCTTPATCRVCGITNGSADGHNYSRWDIWDYPTCTEEGHEVSWCTICHNRELRLVKPLGHKYVAGICSICGDDSNVYADVSGVTINHTTLNLYIGDTSQLEATITPENAKDKTVKWFTSDDAVVQISSSGKITAKGKGSATITVTTVDGNYSATCMVTVTEPPLSVKISMGVEYFMGSSISALGVFAEAIPSGGSGNYVEYYLKVYHNGTLVAEGAKSELIVTLANGIYTAEVYVKDSSGNEATASETFRCQGYQK